MKSKRIVPISIVLVSFAMIVFACWFCVNSVGGMNGISIQTSSPGEVALGNSQRLVEYIEKHPSALSPDDLPRSISVSSECWNLLQPLIVTNLNRYTLTIFEEFDTRTPIPDRLIVHDYTTAKIHAAFPDSTIEMFYYQGQLQSCKILKTIDNSTPDLTPTP